MAQDTFRSDELVRQRRRQVRRHTRFVSVLKYLLPIVAAGLVLMLALWSQIRIDEGRFRIGMTEVATIEVDKLTMSNPRFEGIDDRDRPFTVTADEASQVKDDTDIVELKRPQADMTMEDGTWLALSADTGRYLRGAQRLSLEGSVSLFQDRGYELHTDRVSIDFNAGTAESSSRVFGQGPVGELSGSGLKLSEKGAVIQLLGESRILFHPDRQELSE
jgi:lipopolysaccharide export system protein LptC